MREPSRHALGWRACLHLRRRRDASAAGSHAYRIRQEGLASLAPGVGHANSTTRALPDGGKLRTLRDAATHVTGLANKESDLPEWQAAIEALMLVADRGGPTMFARIGVMRALNRHVERVFDPSRKEKHWDRRKLARDR
jgi:hypothetical protein